MYILISIFIVYLHIIIHFYHIYDTNQIDAINSIFT